MSREEDFKTFDIKLIDGKYFKNVLVCNDSEFEDKKEEILDNQYTNENGKVIYMEMYLFHINDDDCVNCLATIHSVDIEYICNPYKDREVI